MSNEVHRKTVTLFPGNSMTVAELEPLTIQLGGSCSNHYATLLPLKKEYISNWDFHNTFKMSGVKVLFFFTSLK